MREKKERKRWTGDEIVAVIRRHLVERVELSKVCEEAGCHPSQVFGWEKKFFEGGAVADTCFAILFLRRATKPLRPVASEDKKK